MLELDCRGLACPQPVLNTKDALEEIGEGAIRIIVDNEPAVGNVTRFAESQGATVASEVKGNDFVLTISKGEAQPTEEVAGFSSEKTDSAKPKLVVRIAGEFMGSGDEKLGRVLMKAFIKSLADASLKPWRVVLYNSGAKLSVQGSENLEDLKALEAAGIEVFTCGTCLDFYGLKDSLGIGQVTNMFEIIETLSAADRVVSP